MVRLVRLSSLVTGLYFVRGTMFLKDATCIIVTLTLNGGHSVIALMKAVPLSSANSTHALKLRSGNFQESSIKRLDYSSL